MHERDPHFTLIVVLIWAWFLAPIVPLGLAWAAMRRRTAGAGPRGRTQLVFLAMMSLSEALLVAGLAWAPVIGTDYTDRRFATVWANLVVMAVSTIATAWTRGGVKLELVTAGVFLTFAWFYVAAMSAVV